MEIKTCKDCRHGCIDEDFIDYYYECMKHEFEMSEEEYLTCNCDDYESYNWVDNKKKQINFRKVKEME